MKNIKKILIILSLILIVTLTIILLPKESDNMKVNNNKNLLSNKNIALMLEQDNGTYNESTSNTWPSKEEYIFNPFLSKCDKGGKLSYDETKNVVNVKSTKTEKCYLYFDEYNYENYCKNSDENSLVCDILRNKDETIIYHDGKKDFDTEENSNLEAGDMEYRFAGASNKVNNFVCLDGGATSDGICANKDADLYRIIGFFKNDDDKYEAKLIKYDYATKEELGDSTIANSAYMKTYEAEKSYYIGNNLANVAAYAWSNSKESVTSGGNINSWELSNLNKVNLNDYYYNNLIRKNSFLSNGIIKHSWVIGGSGISTTNSKEVYDNELGSNKVKIGDKYCYDVSDPINSIECKEENVSHENFIGLVYLSDYFYAYSPSNWNRYDKNNNWMYRGLHELTITRNITSSTYARDINASSTSGNNYVWRSANAVRPSFYLSTSIKLKSGNGTYNNPYRLYI